MTKKEPVPGQSRAHGSHVRQIRGVHQLGNPVVRGQTRGASGDQTCLSCQTCHKHKDEDLHDLQRRYDELTDRGTTSPEAAAIAPPAPVTPSEG